MKTILAALAITAVMISPAMAADAETCATVKSLAETIMEARQIGVDVSDLMAVSTGDAKMDNLQQKLVIDAFSFPAYSTDEFQAKEVREFGARHYINCIK